MARREGDFNLIGVWMMLASLPAAFINDTFAGALLLVGFVVNGFFVGADLRTKHDARRPREVHHYHRITIDQHGNAVEVTNYEERH